MTHDEKCESKAPRTEPPGAWPVCSCADRAIAKARREGRIEGFMLANNRWADSEGYVCKTHDDCAVEVDDEWPEDKP